jgi:CMP-N-acetylneuraminic acid synthetase
VKERGSPILVIIPARGGSKGIPKKNLSPLHGKSLTEWAIISARQINFDKFIVLSSDLPEILDLSSNYLDVIPSSRPEELSQDYIADYQVLRHELIKAESDRSEQFECVVMLQPTSPIRNPLTLNACVDAVVNRGKSSAWSVVEVPKRYHPRKQLKIVSEKLRLAIDSPTVIARQQLSRTYIRTGVCYAFARSTVLSDEKLLGSNGLPVVCDWTSVNIDEPEDLVQAHELSKISSGILIPKGRVS